MPSSKRLSNVPCRTICRDGYRTDGTASLRLCLLSSHCPTPSPQVSRDHRHPELRRYTSAAWLVCRPHFHQFRCAAYSDCMARYDEIMRTLHHFVDTSLPARHSLELAAFTGEDSRLSPLDYITQTVLNGADCMHIVVQKADVEEPAITTSIEFIGAQHRKVLLQVITGWSRR
jgi:hypothetical protein